MHFVKHASFKNSVEFLRIVLKFDFVFSLLKVSHDKSLVFLKY